MIYIDHQIDQYNLQAALAVVSPQRRAHALRFRHEHDQRLSVAAYRLLQQALSVEYGIEEPPVFEFEAQGKPKIVGQSHIHFSLSHCHEAAACAVAGSPIGIDVESLSSFDADIVPTVMSEDEQRQIARSANPRLTFIRLWTMKESLLKMTGEVMAADIRHVLTNYSLDGVHFHTTIYPEFICTVCD